MMLRVPCARSLDWPAGGGWAVVARRAPAEGARRGQPTHGGRPGRPGQRRRDVVLPIAHGETVIRIGTVHHHVAPWGKGVAGPRGCRADHVPGWHDRRMPSDDDVLVLVEIPGGSRNKYEMDVESGRIMLDRMLFTAMRYPADYGYIEGTLAEDGDPLDALVLVGEPTFPGCIIRARPIAVFHMSDEKGPDEKVILVPLKDPQWSAVGDVGDVPPNLLNEIEHFFTVYKDLEPGETDVRGYGDRGEALAIIHSSRERAGA